MHTLNLADENFQKLAAMFPNAVTETINEDGEVVRAIDADVLRQEISCSVVEGMQERYRFTWPDKKKSVVLANQPIAKTLRLDRSKSVGRDGTPGSIDTDNIYIEGDNLDALKLLRETYLGKVKMIYIDPPYNTGSDFIYEDDFSQSREEYLSGSGQFDEQGNRLVPNLESNGRFHTDWLNMLYPRLRLARDLLTDDGVIFISIDDHEIRNLSVICNEIFGIQNYIATMIWQKRTSPDARKKISTAHEYVLLYAKNKELAEKMIHLIPMDADDSEKYSNPDNDPRGPWVSTDFGAQGYRPNQMYQITTPGGATYYPSEGRCWKNTEEGFNQLLKEGRMWFGLDGKGVPRKKLYLQEREGKNIWTWWDNKSVGHTQEATQALTKLMGSKTIFDYPKPVRLITRMLQLTTDSDSIVLDFFSGSATTAEAAMQLNAKDGGHRKFILIQINVDVEETEEAKKAGYETICEIGEERIRRAGKKILSDPNNSSLLTPNSSLDVGFRVFRVDSSNMNDVYYSAAELKQEQIDLLAENIKPDRTPEDLLIQVMLDMGILLSSKIEETEIAGKKVFSVADGYLIACFDKDVTEDTVTEIAKRKPFYAVFRDSSMASDSVITNFEQIFETYSPKTERKVL